MRIKAGNLKGFTVFFLSLLILSFFTSLYQVDAADIFSDDFESGDLSAWTGTNTNGGSTVAASSTYAHNGTYSARSIVSSDGQWAVVYKTISSSIVYMQGYLYVSSVGSTDGVRPFAELVNNWNPVGRAGINKSGASYFWSMSYGNGGGVESWNNSAVSLVTGQWYKYKVAAYCDGTVGWTELTIDDVLVISNHGVNTGSLINTVDVGTADYAITTYHDTILVSNTDIITPSYYPYIQRVSNIDGVADIGAHGNFSAQQKYDSIYDVLTEADNDTATSTIGKTSGSGTSYRTTAANEVRLGVYTASATGEVQSIVFYGRGASTSQNCKAIICNSSGYILANGVGSAVSVSTTAGAKTLTFADPKPVTTAGESYWVGLVTAGAVRVYYDATTGGASKQDTSNSYASPTDPTDAGDTTETWRVMYANVNNVNYVLQLEEQFSNITDVGDVAEVCVASGNFSGEALSLQVWNGSWNTLGVLSANQWSNFTASSFINGSDLYVRLLAGTETDDLVASTWQIDAVYLWVYNSTSGESYVFVLSESASLSGVAFASKAVGKVSVEGVSVGDGFVLSKQLSRSFADSVAVASVFVSQKAMLDVFNEAPAVSGVFASQKGMVDVFSESVDVVSVLVTAKSIYTALSEVLSASFGVSDGLSVVKGLLRSFSESVAASASLFSLKAMQNVFSEAVALSAGLDVSKALRQIISEVFSSSVGVDAGLFVTKNLAKLFSEVVGFGDLCVHQVSIFVLALEVVAAETCSVFANLDWSIAIHAAFFELVGSVTVSSLLNPHFPLGPLGLTDEEAFVVGGVLCGIIVFAIALSMFLVYRRKDD